MRGWPVLGGWLSLRTVLWRRPGGGSWPGVWLSRVGTILSWWACAWLTVTRWPCAWLTVVWWSSSGLTIVWWSSSRLAIVWRSSSWLAIVWWARAWLSGGWAIAWVVGRGTIAGVIGGWPISGLTVGGRAIAWVSVIMRGRTINRPLGGVGWAVVWRMIAPVSAVSGIAGVVGWSRVIPDGRWTIAADPDSSPWAAVVVDAVTPSPSPASPSPRLVVGYQRTDSDSCTEGDESCCYDRACAGRSVDDGGVVLRDVDDLRLGGLNDVDGLIGDCLDFDLLLLVGAEGS